MAAIFADLEGFGIANRLALLFSVKLFKRRTEMLGLVLIALFKGAANLAVALLLFLGIGGDQIGGAVGPTFIELRFQRLERVQFFLEDRVDGDSNIGLERIRFLERIGVVEK